MEAPSFDEALKEHRAQLYVEIAPHSAMELDEDLWRAISEASCQSIGHTLQGCETHI